MLKSKYNMSAEKKCQLDILFNTSYWIAQEGIAFNKFASLCKLQAKNKLSVGVNYTNIMGCRMFIKAISETMSQSVEQDMKNARFLSYLSDGSTDAGIREQEIVYSRYVKDGVPVTKYLGIKQLEHAHAGGTLAAIEAVLCEYLETTEVIYGKGVNCNFDGAAVMSGRLSGVRTKMQEKQPGMVFTHCIAHNLELAVLDSIKSDTNLERLQATISAMFLCYYHSPKKRREIKSISDLLEHTFKQFGGLKRVRWLASRHRALSIIETNYSALVIHQENIGESDDANAQTAKGHVKDIKSVWFVFYLHFSMDFVTTLRSTSLLFQKDALLVCVVNRVIESRISVLESLKQHHGSNYKRLFENLKLEGDDIVYKSTTLNKPRGRRRADVDADEPDRHSIEHYSEVYSRKFEVILSDTQMYLRNRFSNLQRALLSWMTVFDFKVWPRLFTKEDAAFGFMEIESLAEYYREHGFLTDDEACAIPLEWPLIRSRILPLRTQDVLDVYRDLMLENDEEIRNILILVKLMATVSPSTAACERGFSAMNREKNSLRTSLSDARLQDILRICINGVSLDEFDSESALDQWLSTAKKRHLQGHKLTGPRGPQRNPAKTQSNAQSPQDEVDVEEEIIEELLPLEH